MSASTTISQAICQGRQSTFPLAVLNHEGTATGVVSLSAQDQDDTALLFWLELWAYSVDDDGMGAWALLGLGQSWGGPDTIAGPPAIMRPIPAGVLRVRFDFTPSRLLNGGGATLTIE